MIEGNCEFPGTKKQELNGTCSCKDGYEGAQCGKCKTGFHMETGYCIGMNCDLE